MVETMHLWPEERTEANGVITLKAAIETSNSERSYLWYQIPLEYREAVTVGCEPFVLGTLFRAMSRAADLVVHGQVSPSLLRNLEEFQAAWACWRPGVYSKIDILADSEQEQLKADNSTALVAFSGGVDSAFTVLRHRMKRCGRSNRDVSVGLMVHGFDIPLDQEDIFQQAVAKSREMLAGLGMELIPVATNIRDSGENWEDIFATAAASCLMVLQKQFSVGLIGSSEPYQSLVLPWGSNPVTDWLLSSDTFTIIHDGAAFTRNEKIAQIATWPEALKNLRVCWQGKLKDRNCGRCEKCIRTILNFRVVGLGLPECFEQDVSDSQILKLKKLNEPQMAEFEQILLAAKAASISDSWVGALEQCLLQNRSGSNGKLSFRQQLRKKIPFTLRRSIRRLIG